MNMRGSKRGRATSVVDARAFAWDRALVATLEHSSLPWNDALPLAPLAAGGARDRLSLVAQFAAHQALLQFAGIADGDVDPDEWRVVQKRGSDIRLVRIAARACDPSDAPPVLTLAQQFADAIGAELEVFRQSWARADAIYAEAFARVTRDAAADTRWLREAARGAINEPGPEGLRALEAGRHGYASEACIASVQRFTDNVIVLRGASPLERYSALGALAMPIEPAALADRILATSNPRTIFAVADHDAFDEGSRRVVDLLADARHGTWLFPRGENGLPETRTFRIGAPLSERVTLPPLQEPARSYIGALALLGTRVPRALAEAFLRDFLFGGELEELVVDGVTALDRDFVFASDAIRDEAARGIPAASRPAICRVAAAHATGVRAALLWLDGGDAAAATRTLEETDWSVEELTGVPRSILTPALLRRYAHGLIDCGRYRDARDVTNDEYVLARVERRMGDYATALARLERMEPTVLRAELLRLLDRDGEARHVLDACDASVEANYERALHGAQVTLPEEHYLAARLATYRALERSDYEAAARYAHDSYAKARSGIERIDAALDRVFAMFSAGRWYDARIAAVEALREVEETQGDRAAGGILFTLAYLAADNGQFAHAAQRIARLRHYYTSTRDEVRLAELALLTAHLDFKRERFADARRAAQSIYDRRGHHDQIREAAALILDELDWREGIRTPLRSTGKSGNAELTRRHHELATRKEPPPLVEPPPASDAELSVLRAAATREFPFQPHDLDLLWCFATRNRLGHWSAIGSSVEHRFDDVDGPDWIECSDRELLYLEGCSRWTSEGREAVAALFRTRAENHRFRRIAEQEESARPAHAAIDGIVGQSPAIRAVESLVARIAKRDVPVCILGESGTGKELIARAIHRQSSRRQKIFTAVNCAALPDNLVESELFGHVRGAFTGADRDRAGLIETTDGGTLFLDEIGELPLLTQAKLLRFLQEGEFRRVGDTANRSADVRIVSATNRKLDSAVEEGRFRDDLYYRVRGVEVILPALRERGADILLLARHFLSAEREKHRSGATSFSSDVEAIFSSYGWPGNVRELQNTIRAAHAMAGEAKEIDVEHLPERLRNVAPARVPAGSYQHAVARFKRELIERSLLQVGGNQNRAAAMLRMSRQALAYQIRELGILVRG